MQAEKVVVLEELAAKFKLKTQDVIKRVTTLQEDGTLPGQSTGVTELLLKSIFSPSICI